MNAPLRRARAIVAALVAALALSLASVLPAHASGPGSITVTITGSGSASGLIVYAQGPDFGFAMTDDTGTAVFSDLALGDYNIVVWSSGEFQEATLAVNLTEEASAWTGSLERVPWPTGTASIAATIVDQATGSPVAGAHVRVSRNDAIGRNIEGYTDADGLFVAENVVAGVYSIGTDATPDYLGAATDVTVGEGQAVATTIRVLAADSVIEGRIVDPDGVGVADLPVMAVLNGPEFFGWATGMTDAGGYYSLADASAGTWEVSVNADQAWERATISIAVTAGATATAPDLVLTPRTSGTISGLVASSDGIAETIGGFFDVCVTALNPDGSPVPNATVTTGGDSFYFFWLAPGDYTVLFEDCDPDRSPHRYQSTYLGGSATLDGATIVTVETFVDTWLDTTTLEPAVAEPPAHDAVPVAKNRLDHAMRGLIGVPDELRRGQTVEIVVGEEFAGDWVSAWVYSNPQQWGGWHQVAADGTVTVPIPLDAPLGRHRVSIQDADDELIGWEFAKVVKQQKD